MALVLGLGLGHGVLSPLHFLGVSYLPTVLSSGGRLEGGGGEGMGKGERAWHGKVESADRSRESMVESSEASVRA